MEKYRETLSRNNASQVKNIVEVVRGGYEAVGAKIKNRKCLSSGALILRETRDWWSGPSGRDDSDALTAWKFTKRLKKYIDPPSSTKTYWVLMARGDFISRLHEYHCLVDFCKGCSVATAVK